MRDKQEMKLCNEVLSKVAIDFSPRRVKNLLENRQESAKKAKKCKKHLFGLYRKKLYLNLCCDFIKCKNLIEYRLKKTCKKLCFLFFKFITLFLVVRK